MYAELLIGSIQLPNSTGVGEDFGYDTYAERIPLIDFMIA